MNGSVGNFQEFFTLYPGYGVIGKFFIGGWLEEPVRLQVPPRDLVYF